MALGEICAPALIYLVFSITQISIDSFQGMYNTAFAKILVSLVFTILLNYLCNRGLGIISWFMVFIPFMLMTLIIGLLLYFFGLSPSTGRLNINGADPQRANEDMIDYRKLNTRAGGVMGGLESRVGGFTQSLESDISGAAGDVDSRVKNLGGRIENDLGMQNSDYYNQRDQGTNNDFARGSDSERDSSDTTSDNSTTSSKDRRRDRRRDRERRRDKKKSSSRKSSNDPEGFLWNY